MFIAYGLQIALAQSFSFQVDPVLTPSNIPWTTTGIHRPSMVYDDTFITVFETDVLIPGCTRATSIAWGTSLDGMNWSIRNSPIDISLTQHPCGITDLSLLRGDNGWLMLGKDIVSQQHTMFRIKNHNVTERSTTGLNGLTDVSIARIDDDWRGVGLNGTSMVNLSSTNGTDWTVVGTALSPGQLWWATQSVRSPSLTCIDSSTPWSLHLGGDLPSEVRLNTALSSDAVLWFYGLQPSVTSWIAWDVISEGATSWALAETASGIGVGMTTFVIPSSNMTRYCFSP